MKSFLFVMQNLYPVIGGAEQSAATLMTELRKRGHIVNHICQSNYDEELLETIAHHDVIVTQLNWAPMTIDRAEQHGKKSVIFIRSMENVCRIVHQDPAFLSKCEQLCKGCPHKITGYEQQGRALLKADLIIGNSKWTSNMFKEQHNLDSEYIYPFIDENIYENIDLKESRRYIKMNKWSTPDGTDIFLDIAEKMPLHRFKIVGYESYHTPRSLPKNVEFTGPTDDLDSVYEDALLWLYPNLHGTFGRVVIEAQMVGIPVVGAARGPVLEDKMTPYVVEDYRNAREWVKVIKKVLRKNKKPMKDFSEYNKDSQVDKFIELCNNL